MKYLTLSVYKFEILIIVLIVHEESEIDKNYEWGVSVLTVYNCEIRILIIVSFICHNVAMS